MTPSGDDSDVCGHPTPHGDNDTCTRRGKYPDGYCYQHSDHADPESRGGQRDGLNPQVQAEVCKHLAEGHPITVAAGMAGISETTYHEWHRRGRKQSEGRFAEFAERTDRARVEGQRDWEERAFEYAKEAESFGAVMEILRKRYPNDWYSTTDPSAEDDVSGVNIVPLSADRETERAASDTE